MAGWFYFDGAEDEYSGCTHSFDWGYIFVTPNKPGHGFAYFVTMLGTNIVDYTNSPTREAAQRAALDALITQLDAWKEQAVKARVELGQQEEVQ